MLRRPREPKGRQFATHLPIVLVVVMVFLIYFVLGRKLLENPATPERLPEAVSAATYQAADGSLTVPLAELKDSKVKAITYDLSTTEQAPVIVRVGDSGSVQTLLGICRQCRRSHLGAYVQRGKLMCGRCRGPMRLPELNENTAAASDCAARELKHTQVNGSISIPAKEMRGPE